MPLAAATKIEITLLAFISITSAAVFCAAFLWPWLAVLSFAVPVALTALALWRWESCSAGHQSYRCSSGRLSAAAVHTVLCLLTGIGWLINGFILYLIFQEVTETLEIHHAIMIMTSNLFIGVASGLPGGLGITESYIGGMMYWLSTPPGHLVIAVAAFRILTFWVWIPIGWVALLLNGLLYGRKKPGVTSP